MSAVEHKPEVSAGEAQRTAVLLREAHEETHRRTDRMFAGLLVAQWIGGVGAALLISPRTWIGASSSVHEHVWSAVFLNGALAAVPLWLVWRQPGRPVTRHAIAVAQMFTSAVLIHLTGGRIETHFHVFGSLAFIAFYRDWRVLVTATVVVAVDHMARGIFWPQSVFGVMVSSPWRWIEHAAWVIFEDTFLFLSIRRSLHEMAEVAARRARLEVANRHLEERTGELQREAEQRRVAQAKLDETHAQLVRSSRQAGMAEVATGVLHNVGNVLNSVNVSASLVVERLQRSKVVGLEKAAHLLGEHRNNLAGFLSRDPRGTVLPDYLGAVARQLADDRTQLLEEAQLLRTNLEHIKRIVAMQQNYARLGGVREQLSLAEVADDAVRLTASGLERQEVKIVREFAPVPLIFADRHAVLQILVNLLNNAGHALVRRTGGRRIAVRIASADPERVTIAVEDNGEGIAPENLVRIFNHGFTTKKDGHGFGLHSGANAAKEMGGSLAARSDGPGRGATFVLELPVAQPATATEARAA